MKEKLKTKKEIEKARNIYLGLYILTIGIVVSLFFLNIGLLLIFFGIVGFIMELVGKYQYKKNPPSYIPITCPYCNTNHEVLPDAKTFVCPECKNRVLVESGQGKKITT